jgi:hypothetical protein
MPGLARSRAALAQSIETTATIALGAAGLALALMVIGSVAAAHEFLNSNILVQGLLMAGSTAALSIALCRFALRAPTEAKVWVRLLAAVPLGILNLLLCLLATGLASEPITAVEGIPSAMLIAVAFGPIVGAPAGFLFGVFFAPPMIVAHRLRARPSHDAADAARIFMGAWLALLVAFARAWIAAFPFPKWDPTPAEFAALTDALTAGALAVGVALALGGLRGNWLRARWRAKAVRGAGYRLREVRAGSELSLLPLSRVDLEGAVVLEEVLGHGSAYRDGHAAKPLARVAASALPGGVAVQ